LVATGKRKEAHETVRLEFRKAPGRLRDSISPDLFTAFHEPMEEFTEILSKGNANPVELKRRIDRLSKPWKYVESTGLDQKLFAVSPEREARHSKLVGKEREALSLSEKLI
jgi:hypothetical protein